MANAHGAAKEAQPVPDAAGAPAPEAAQPPAQGERTAPWGGSGADPGNRSPRSGTSGHLGGALPMCPHRLNRRYKAGMLIECQMGKLRQKYGRGAAQGGLTSESGGVSTACHTPGSPPHPLLPSSQLRGPGAHRGCPERGGGFPGVTQPGGPPTLQLLGGGARVAPGPAEGLAHGGPGLGRCPLGLTPGPEPQAADACSTYPRPPAAGGRGGGPTPLPGAPAWAPSTHETPGSPYSRP